MTSTSFNVGLTGATRSSSRVLRPPGGGHTDIFGGEPEPTRGRRQFPNANAAQGDELKAMNGTAPAQNGQAAATSPNEPASSPNEPASSPNEPAAAPEPAPAPAQAPAPTPVSPKTETPNEGPKESIKAEPPKAEAPKRVRVPPGGFSSGLW